MIITTICITVVLISIFLVGIPLSWLLNGRTWTSEQAWLVAPFLGISAIVLILQNLVYLDLPIRYTASLIWMAGLVGWIWIYRCRQLRIIFKTAPRALFSIALAVYLLQGLGMLIVGAKFYVGRARGDQYNYTTLAQFLSDEKFSLPLSEIGHRPYLANALYFKIDRLGQSVLHSFFATSSLQSAKSLFEPTILLSTPLIVLAVYGLACRFGMQKPYALATGAAAGLLPGITMLHLESFLSHALALPLLLFFPLLLDDLIEQLNWQRISIGAVVAAGIVSIYTEFWIILLGLATLMLGTMALGGTRTWRLLGCWGALALAPFALNPLFTNGVLKIFGRLDMTLLEGIYPWALSIEGLGRLWLGDLAVAPNAPQTLIHIYTFIMTALGYYGLMHMAISHMSIRPVAGATLERWRALVFALGVLSLALLPLGVLARDSQHLYQFYKLLLSISPLLVLGAGLAFQPYLSIAAGTLPAMLTNRVALLQQLPATLAIGIMLTVGIYGTATMVLRSASPERLARSNSHLLSTPEMQQLQEQLEALQGRNLFFYEVDETRNTGFVNAWLAYFARHNQLWLGNSHLNGIDLASSSKIHSIIDLKTIPTDIIILSRTDQPMAALTPKHTVLWSNGLYQLWQPANDAQIIPLTLKNQNGVTSVDGQSFFWMGQDDTTLDIITSASGMLRLMATFRLGPSLPDREERTIFVLTDAGYQNRITLMNGDGSISLPVAAGHTTVTLRPLDQPTIKTLPNGDARPLILGVQGLTAVLDDSLAVVEQVQNLYGVQQRDGEAVFWMGQEPTKLHVSALQAGTLTLQANFRPGPSLPETSVRRVMVESTGYREEVSLGEGEQQISLPVQAGMSTITLTVLDTPTVAKLANGDKRTLLLRVQGLTVWLDP
jgi:hypothetical protein